RIESLLDGCGDAFGELVQVLRGFVATPAEAARTAAVRVASPDQHILAGNFGVLLDLPPGRVHGFAADEEGVRAHESHRCRAVMDHAGDDPTLVANALAGALGETSGHLHAGRWCNVHRAETDLQHDGTPRGVDLRIYRGAARAATGLAANWRGVSQPWAIAELLTQKVGRKHAARPNQIKLLRNKTALGTSLAKTPIHDGSSLWRGVD